MPLPTIFGADKAIARFPGWSQPEPETGYVWFDAPLEIGGVVEPNLLLHGGAMINHPDEHVTFELKASGPRLRAIPIARLDWRSLAGTHSNKKRKGWPLYGKTCSFSHFHGFDLNWMDDRKRMRPGNLPQADDFEQQIQTFEELRELAGNLLRISNISIVSRPPWEYNLFRDG
jgi:hypothetical protein